MYTSSSKFKRVAGMAGLMAGGLVAGMILAGTMGANAASPTPTPSTPTTAPSDGSTSPSSGEAGEAGSGSQSAFPEHGTTAHEGAEGAVTGADATRAQQAAVAALGGGTAGAVTRDMTGTGYEVTVVQSDGTSVEVHLDSSFAVRGPGENGTSDTDG